MTTAAVPLDYSFDEVGHVYSDAHGTAITSVTQILDGVGISDYSSVPEKRLEYKRDIGDAVHYAARYLDEDRLDYDTIQPAWANYLLAYQQFLEDTEFKIEAIEKQGVHAYSAMKFGYTLDRIGRFPGMKHRVLLELKCAYAEEESWRIQLAAYEMTIEKNPADEFIVRLALQLKPDKTYKLWPDINGYRDPNDRKVFLWALALTNWKITNQLSLKGKPCVQP